MDGNALALVGGLAALGAAALAGFAAYRWRCRRRARKVRAWVEGYLAARHGGQLPRGLRVNCSDDDLWPVLVDYDEPGTGPRPRLRFYWPDPRPELSPLPGENGGH